MKALYDNIAEDYKGALISLKRRYTLEETFFHYLGDVTGKSVLDMGCGEGYYSRLMKKCGAATVAGVDISRNMIDLAIDEEKKHPLGISFRCCDASKLPKVGEFDIVTAAYLLHYSKTKDELFAMCRNIHTNLKKGGRFVTLNLYPPAPLQFDKKYDSTITVNGPLKEGCIIDVTLYLNDEPVCSFTNYHWEKGTYEKAFKEAGFKKVLWHNLMVSKEGLDKFGADFWENYLKQPGVCVIECS